MNAPQEINVTGTRNDPQRPLNPPQHNENDIEVELRWQLKTLLGIAASYFGFFSILILTLSASQFVWLSVFPLLIYDVVKIVFTSTRLCKEWDIEGKDDMKDVIECVFMIIYKVL